jgi:hypothetical protein
MIEYGNSTIDTLRQLFTAPLISRRLSDSGRHW